MDQVIDTPEGVDEPIDAEVVVDEEVVETTVEELARDLGWNPDYEGDNPKTAAEYIKATNDIKAHHARDLKALREEVSRIGETNARIVEDNIAKRRAELDEEYKKKWEANDFAGANDVLKAKQNLEAKPVPQAPSGEVAEWASRRPWFNSDPLATQTAHTAAVAAARMGKTPSEQLSYADEQVKLHHPHLFTPPKKQPAVNKDTARTPPAKKTGKTFADLPPEAREAGAALEERGVTTKEAYAREYFNGGQ